MKIPAAIRKAVNENDRQKKIDRLARQFQSSVRHEYYPRLRDLRAWMFESNMHLINEVWGRFMQIRAEE